MINLDQDQKGVRIKKEILVKGHILFVSRELTPGAFKNGIFPIKITPGERLKISTPKKMLQRLPIAYAQLNAYTSSENLLNETRRFRYSLYQEKEIPGEIYNSILNSIKL